MNFKIALPLDWHLTHCGSVLGSNVNRYTAASQSVSFKQIHSNRIDFSHSTVSQALAKACPAYELTIAGYFLPPLCNVVS